LAEGKGEKREKGTKSTRRRLHEALSTTKEQGREGKMNQGK
jgi:hypothetical protein